MSIDASRSRCQSARVAIRRVASLADIVECLQIRVRVFVVEQAVPIEEEVDDYDAAAIQYLAGVGNRTVGTARLVKLGGGVGKIGRLAVSKEWRGTGVGSSLVEHIIRTDGADCTVLILDSQLAAIPFYERFGFRLTGDVFMDAGIPHRRMERFRSS